MTYARWDYPIAAVRPNSATEKSTSATHDLSGKEGLLVTFDKAIYVQLYSDVE